MLADVASVERTGSLSGSQADCLNVSELDGSGMDVLLASLAFFNHSSGGCFLCLTSIMCA